MEITCSCCNTAKPDSEFYDDSQSKTGKSYHCKTCIKARAKAHHSANREKHNELGRAWHHANKEKANAASRAYQKSHKNEASERSRAWRKKNESTLKERDHAKYLKRRDAVLKRNKEYVSENREKTAAYRKEYGQKNRVKIRAQIQSWYMNKRHTEPAFRILCALRRRITHAIKGHNKSARTVALLGCTVDAFMAHLEKQFIAGMTWENYGKWHIDHIRPCALYDFSDPAQQRACFHFTNMQPLWGEVNQSKGARLTPQSSAYPARAAPSPS